MPPLLAGAEEKPDDMGRQQVGRQHIRSHETLVDLLPAALHVFPDQGAAGMKLPIHSNASMSSSQKTPAQNERDDLRATAAQMGATTIAPDSAGACYASCCSGGYRPSPKR